MSVSFYFRLALEGMRKNRKLYLPYILSCVGMVMMDYILHALSGSPLVAGMVHGGDIGFILFLGQFVVAAFALMFLFYTNSFLIRRRNREFGLYSVLGMNRGNICRIVIWESLIIAVVSIVGGILLGIAFSKLAELGLLNMMRGVIGYSFTVSTEAVLWTALIFGGIFLLLMFRSIIQVRKCKPLELMRSEAVGEKPLKTNWVFALIGVLILGAAYWMAVSIKNPLTALLLFFVAVIMVIVATYILFISGSVALCKILQKNKSYYYKKEHFISVSSMAYRMKRNGAGLASICILATMVLVMISSTGSLYFGSNDAMRTRYPSDAEFSVELKSIDNLTDDKISEFVTAYESVFEKHSFVPQDVHEYRYASIAGYLDGDKLDPNPNYDSNLLGYENVRSVYFISAEDYSRESGIHYALKDGEALLYTLRCNYDKEDLQIGNLTLHIVCKLDSYIDLGEASSLIMPSLMLVIPDYETLRPLSQYEFGGDPMLSVRYYYGYDSNAPEEDTIKIFQEQKDLAKEICGRSEDGFQLYYGCLPMEKDDFYATFGGMFFLGIILSVVFIFAAAVIIYYKQISEGYEDQKRFQIMRNVGMTAQDIRRTINSQVLTVFFAPLICAGLHLGFAFPFVWKLLQLFNMRNLTFVLCITAAAFIGFGLFYVLIYNATARAYYNIVSTGHDS